MIPLARLPLAAALFVLALLFGALALYLARVRVELVPAREDWYADHGMFV